MTLPTDRPTAAGPTFSPDGRWWWDGGRWLPVTGLAQQPLTASAPRRASTGRVVALVLAGAALVVALLAAVAVPTFLQQRASAERTTVRTALMEAQIAQVSHAIAYGTHTDDVAALADLGFRPHPDVDVTVVDVSATSYCMAAGPAGGEPTVWVSEAGVLEDEPC